MTKWLECLTAEWDTDGSSRTLGPKAGCLLTVHPAVNGYLVATLGKLKAARKGTGHPTSLRRRLRISVFFIRHSSTYRIVYGTNLYLLYIRYPQRHICPLYASSFPSLVLCCLFTLLLSLSAHVWIGFDMIWLEVQGREGISKGGKKRDGV